MGKTQKPEDNHEEKVNKGHKTLREKLRIKREELRLHKKQKSQQKKQYSASDKKEQFNTRQGKEDVKIKQKKVLKYINKFINIYEDDLEEFYDMFKTFDEKGFIDISELENKSLKKCLKKLFKHLPLKKEKTEYRKESQVRMNLQRYMRQMVNYSIEHYLQHGSNSEENQQSSEEQNHQNKKNKTKLKQEKNQIEALVPQQVRPDPETAQEVGPSLMGPYIPEGDKQKMAKLFEEQLEEMKKNKDLIAKQEEDEFNQIFMGKTRKQMKTVIPDSNQSVPEHLMAKGSALIGQKVQIDEQQIEEFNKINRPKKLIEMHKEMMQERGSEEPKVRKPFSRQRDILGQGTQSYMSNSTFFDFKNRMSKPKSTNQFL